jgi:5-methylcytosine-specific restriction endonuclease McrA
MAEWQKANRERVNAQAVAWGKANRDKKNANQRARRAQYRGRLSAAEWCALCDEFGNVCLACGVGGKLEADHVIPVSIGGTSDHDNFQPLCRRCNAAKGATAVDFRPMFRLRMRTGAPHDFPLEYAI